MQTQELCSNLGCVHVCWEGLYRERNRINTEGTRDGRWEGGRLNPSNYMTHFDNLGPPALPRPYPLPSQLASRQTICYFPWQAQAPGLQHTVEDVHSQQWRSSIPSVLSPVLNTENNGCAMVELYRCPDLAV